MAEDDRDELLTLAEAGKRLGRHPEALRALVRRHRLPARRDNLGRLLLRLADLPADLSAPERGRPAHPAEPEYAQPAQVNAIELLEALADERVARARAEGELAAEARRSADLASSLAVERSRADRLEAELRELRRPLLLRILDGLRRR